MASVANDPNGHKRICFTSGDGDRGGHYLQVTNADWTRAVGDEKSGAQSGAPEARKAVQHPTAPDRTDSPQGEEDTCFSGVSQADASECEAAANVTNGQART